MLTSNGDKSVMVKIIMEDHIIGFNSLRCQVCKYKRVLPGVGTAEKMKGPSRPRKRTIHAVTREWCDSV